MSEADPVNDFAPGRSSPTALRSHLPAGLLFLLAGCAAQPVPSLPPDITDTPFSESGAADAPQAWWTSFGDAELDALIDEALAENFDLTAAWERLRAARALARRERAALIPEVDASLDWSSRSGDLAPTGDNNVIGAGLAAEYELDLWGRVRASSDAESFRAAAAAADYQAAALSLAAEVSLAWYRLIESEKSIELLAAQVEVNDKVLQSLTARFRGGQVRAVDILRQRQLVEATRERLILANADRQVLMNQLAILLGRAPQDYTHTAVDDLPVLPPLPRTGLPAELVLRRPDVQSAYRLLEAADRDVAAAISSRYPRLNLMARAASEDDGDVGLFDDWLQSIMAELAVPVIDGGRRRAEVRRAEALRAQRLAEFSQASLVSFREVEDALVGELRQRERLESLRTQAELQSAAYRQLQNGYFNGSTDFIDVLTALSDNQQLERDQLAAQRLVIESRISLYRALAGPITTPREQAGS